MVLLHYDGRFDIEEEDGLEVLELLGILMLMTRRKMGWSSWDYLGACEGEGGGDHRVTLYVLLPFLSACFWGLSLILGIWIRRMG